MSSIDRVDRYRPPREGYQPPTLPPKPPPTILDRKSRSPARRRDVHIPPAAPSPPTLTSRTSPPRPLSRRSAPSPAQTSTPRSHTRPNQWFFTLDEVASSPSVTDGLSRSEDRLRRSKGVNFIYQAGILLELPQITLWVAGVFFHRFYMRCSMVEDKGGIHHYNIAATALFLANKTEENCRKTRDLIIAVARVAQKNSKLIIDEQSKEYWRWRDSILTYEELMLETLTFDLMVDHPYNRLYESLRELNLIHNRRLRDAAWAFCNDSCLSTLPLLMNARDISVAAIFFASVAQNEKIEDVNGEPWWNSLKGNEDKMTTAIKVMTEFYEENPLRKQERRAGSSSPIFRLENTRRRGETTNSQLEAASSQNGTPTSVGRGTQSPLPTSNGRDDKNENLPVVRIETSGEDAAAELASQATQGDSDAALKAAANDLNIHDGKPNGSDIQSPGGKRKELEFDNPDTERQPKRARTAEAE